MRGLKATGGERLNERKKRKKNRTVPSELNRYGAGDLQGSEEEGTEQINKEKARGQERRE